MTSSPTSKTASHPIVAALLDRTMRPFYPSRRVAIPRATGRVVEIGAGTGLNLGLYRDVERLVLVEPDPAMRVRLARKRDEIGARAEIVAAAADALPLDDASVDTVVITYALCTIPDVAAALAEARRVLAKGGALVVVEHVRSTRRLERALQRALTPLWRAFSGGCHLDRSAADALAQHGFVVDERLEKAEERHVPLFPLYAVVARPRA
jgi:ubiquinone/menaquinone biosynthesis C-methylase UbiE